VAVYWGSSWSAIDDFRILKRWLRMLFRLLSGSHSNCSPQFHTNPLLGHFILVPPRNMFFSRQSKPARPPPLFSIHPFMGSLVPPVTQTLPRFRRSFSFFPLLKPLLCCKHTLPGLSTLPYIFPTLHTNRWLVLLLFSLTTDSCAFLFYIFAFPHI